MPDYRKILLTTLAFALAPQPLFAAPFCVQTQAIASQCDYFDAAQCRKRAEEMNGYCVANPAELVIPPGGTGNYCMVLSNRQAQCIYVDRSSCDNDAGPENGVCIEKSVSTIQKDPYRLDINRNY